MITLFTTAGMINQSVDNTIRSWLELRPQPQVLFFSDEPPTWPEVTHVQIPEALPLIRDLFARARELAHCPVLAYANSDILLGQDCIEVVKTVMAALDIFLVVGHRWNVRVPGSIAFEPGWQEGLIEKGHLHRMTGADYFIFPKSLSLDIPDLYVGRWAWDNWMIMNARRQGIPVVDATEGLRALHQHHLWTHTEEDCYTRHNMNLWKECQPQETEGIIEQATHLIRKHENIYTLERT